MLTESIVDAVKHEFPKAVEVFTYLANDIRRRTKGHGVPFSMVSAIEIGDGFPLLDIHGNPIEPLSNYDIVLNQWAAEDLNAKIGDQIGLTYFEPESTHGAGVEKEAVFTLRAIAKLTKPDQPFRIRRRQVIPAQFLENSPTLANDPGFDAQKFRG